MISTVAWLGYSLDFDVRDSVAYFAGGRDYSGKRVPESELAAWIDSVDAMGELEERAVEALQESNAT